MNEKHYVNTIARKIKCGGKKKKEIKRQLLMDIHMREKQGERLEDVISQMGTENRSICCSGIGFSYIACVLDASEKRCH